MNLIDNRLQVAKLRLAYIVFFVLGNIFLVFALFSNNYFIDNTLSLVIAIVLLLVFVFLLAIKPEYVFIQVKKQKTVVVRTYSAFPLFRKYKSFEIPLNSVVGLEMKKNIFYPRPFVRFVVKIKNKEGKYPWLSFSAVSKTDFNRMKTYFKRLVEK